MIRFEDVSVTYEGSAGPTVRGVDLTVPEGELVLLVGPSGVGKSTLLGTVSGLVPHFTGGTLRGRVTVAGRDTRTHKPRELADVVGTVGQDPLSHFVTDTVEDELAYGMESLGLAPDVMRRRVEETLDLLGLADLRDRPIATLSGGQQQRVAIGSVLTPHPQVLVLDEPTSALDPAAAEEVLAVLQRLVHDLGTTVLMAEHRLERVVQYADQVLLLAAPGEPPVLGDPAELMARSPVYPPVVALGRIAGWSPLPLTVRDARRRAGPLRDRLARAASEHPAEYAPGRSPRPFEGRTSEPAHATHADAAPRTETTAGGPGGGRAPGRWPRLRRGRAAAPTGTYPEPGSGQAGQAGQEGDGASDRRPSPREDRASEHPHGTSTNAAPGAQPTAGKTGVPAPGRPSRLRKERDPAPVHAALVDRLAVRRGRVEALRRVDLTVTPGETVALMGRNGAGKSTLLSTLVGLLEPTSGTVRVGGAVPHRTAPRQLIRHVGLVPQEPRDLLYADTVGAECAAADHDADAVPGACRALVSELLPGIADDTHPRDLSEGQRLALALSIVLTARPPLLLLDEPTRGLDYAAKARLAAVLRGLAAEGHAIVLATHDVELAAEIAHRVVILADGEIVADGPTPEIVVSSPSFAPQVTKILAPQEWLTVTQVRRALDAAGQDAS
ncbi:ATP-binding cassette domain-containing protein [Streptomyces kanamyceticus]|uniref:ATP-binding cassette domain-containing protein n=1 Tax=Streptomyces kanamyceticus TaxID=1967 RepID=A0A5J6GJR7_STRKN|nr:ATP-binding cassette domain-containing protein [Streptomyces kanamyceticus]QEU94664.1 ATP-binding cassette domain-containing protein [Streptomyces kanamyceticus]